MIGKSEIVSKISRRLGMKKKVLAVFMAVFVGSGADGALVGSAFGAFVGSAVGAFVGSGALVGSGFFFQFAVSLTPLTSSPIDGV